jgi:rifampicin phosphotransferase
MSKSKADPGTFNQQKYLLVALTLLFTGMPAHAIPAPDLVINMFASLAQLAGLAMAGVGALALRLGFRKRTIRRRPSHWFFAALLGIACLLAIANIMQYVAHLSQDNQRLEAALWRKPADWQREFDAPKISPESLAEKVAAKTGVQIVDVREPEEYEAAHLHQAENHRYADLLLGRSQLMPSGKELIFVCDSGKRSGEVCEQYQKKGTACQVLEGGYPRWAAQGRPLWLASSGWRARFTALPRYPADTSYLDTGTVSDWVREQEAVFLDVRSPPEFASGHLPHAVNVPLRGMPSAQLAQVLADLVKKPYIAACYDNRSCFHAKVLGLKLVRAGHDFRGRYTVPHEYPVPLQIQEQSSGARIQRALSNGLDYAVSPLALGLQWLAQRLGSLVPALTLLLLLTRLPFMAAPPKFSRTLSITTPTPDQHAALRLRYGNDQFRLWRAMRRWRNNTGQTPWRNLAVSLVQLLIFSLCYAAIRANADWADESLGWIPEISEPDPWGLLSVACAVLGFAVVRHLLPGQTQGARKWAWVLHAATAVSLGFATRHLAAAVVLYLAASLALLLVHRHWRSVKAVAYRTLKTWGLRRARTAAGSAHWIPLEKATDINQHGGKALRLGQLRAAGFQVPQAWVLPTGVLQALFAADSIDLGLWSIIEKQSPLGSGVLYAVRSSSMHEDGSRQSFAGVFHTELQVSKDGLAVAVRRVWDSYRAGSRDRPAAQGAGGVVVQEMLPASFAGVLFTRNPANAATQLIECVAGLGDRLVDGSAPPMSFSYGRLSQHLYESNTPAPIAFGDLLRLGLAVERYFGKPQDIEWAWAHGRFHLLQARDITTIAHAPTQAQRVVEAERDRLMALVEPYALGQQTIVLEQTDLSANLPQPTPLSLSLLQGLRAEGGSTDLALEHLGLTYEVAYDSLSEVQTAFGTTYVLRPQSSANAPRIHMWAAYGLSRRAQEIETDFLNGFLPEFQQEMRTRCAIDFGRLSPSDLLSTLDTWAHQFITQHYVQADIINIAAEFYSQAAIRALRARKLPLSLMFTSVGLGLIPSDLRSHGHRSELDWELAQPRFEEVPEVYERWEQIYRATGHQPGPSPTDPHTPRATLKGLIDRAQRFAELKEQAKHECLRSLALLRRLLLEIDTRYALGGLVFFLQLDELAGLSRSAASLKNTAQQRQEQYRILTTHRPGPVLRVIDLETFENPAVSGQPNASRDETSALRGLWVAGNQSVTACVRWIYSPSDIDALQVDEIAIVQMASPQWLVLLNRSVGLVSAVGGRLSHLAILARERNHTSIFGVAKAHQQLRTGDRVTLHKSGWIEKHARA